MTLSQVNVADIESMNDEQNQAQEDQRNVLMLHIHPLPSSLMNMCLHSDILSFYTPFGLQALFYLQFCVCYNLPLQALMGDLGNLVCQEASDDEDRNTGVKPVKKVCFTFVVIYLLSNLFFPRPSEQFSRRVAMMSPKPRPPSNTRRTSYFVFKLKII